jgi:SSS family solute:Na+ symporter
MLGKPNTTDSSVELDKVNFATTNSFNISAVGVVIVLAALYATWW